LRIPGDHAERREFEIQPSKDVINKGEQRPIRVIFTPQSVKKYEMNLKIDILNVGEGLYSIPIFAESFVPTVRVHPPELLFEEAFLRHKEERELKLINESDLPAKFEVIPQSKESEILAVYSVNKPSGVIPPNKEEILKVTLETRKLREIRLPLSVMIVGNSNLPFVINIIANSKGPIVEIVEKELDFGSVEVLKDWTKTLHIKNKSPIKADFHVFTKTKNSIFKPLQKQGVLEDYGSTDIQVLCTPDDNVTFADTLHFVIKEGVDIDIPLKAKGIGSTIYCKEDLKLITFGLQYTCKLDHKELFVENKGRRPQRLVWQPKKMESKKKDKEKEGNKEKTPVKNDNAEEEEIENAYAIVPDSVTLPPKTGIMFQFRAYSTRKGVITEYYQLMTQVGNDRKQNALLDTMISGEFVNPTLSFSDNKMHFKYSWQQGADFHLISKDLEITNVSQLPTSFTIKVQPPFSVSRDSFSLIPGRSCSLRVDFDPSLKADRVSGFTRSKLQIAHADHHHKEYVNLMGEVCFPNLKLESNLINFGSIMNETNKTVSLTMSNVGEMPLNYEWYFLEDHIFREKTAEELNGRSFRKKDKDIFTVNEIFDILPMNGYLAPGESETVEFLYNALLSQKVKATAICAAEGGPEYQVQLVGDSSLMTYKFNTKSLDYGVLPFNEYDGRDFTLENTGKVTFEYRINLDTIKRKGLVDVTPSSGFIKGFEKQKFHVRMCPGYPDVVDEHFFIEIAHFEPEKITLKANAIFPAMVLDLPRHENPDFLRNLEPPETEEFTSLINKMTDDQKILETEGPVINKAEVEADRKTLVEYINRNLVEKRVQMSKIMESTLQSPPSKLNVLTKDLKKEPPNSVSPGLRKTSGLSGVLSPATKADEIIKASTLRDATSPLSKTNLFGKSAANFDERSQPDDTRALAMTKTTFKGANPRYLDPKVYDRIALSTFVCDLENIVLGGSKKKTFKITNVSNLPMTFNFDAKVFKLLNMVITPERVAKLMPGESISITLAYQTKKNLKFGKNKMIVPIEIRGGPKVNLEVIANITIPEIVFGSENLDFQKVIIGQKKTIFVRFENNKEVTVDWNLSTRADLTSGNDKDGNKFSLVPSSGIIKPGQKQMIEVTFIPTSEKAYSHKFTINIRDNPRVTVINVKGVGTSVNLEFIPEKLAIGPSFPYDNKTIARLDIKNPSEYDTELYSLNFDNTYIQEEEMLRAYEDFITQESFTVPVRQPNTPFWEKIKHSFEVKQKRAEYSRKMKELNAQPQVDQAVKDALQKEIDDFNAANQPVEEVIYPPRVKDELKHHLIVYGPPGCGKSQLVKFLSTTHQRGVINMNELLEWNRQNKTAVAEKANEFLEEKRKAFEVALTEYEKNKKKKKKGEEDIPPNPEEYEFLPEDILVPLLEERLKSPDCNAGVIFDNLANKLYPTELDGLKAILKALPAQHIQFINLHYPLDPSGLEASEIINQAKDLVSHELPKDKDISISAISKKSSKTKSPDEEKELRKSKSSVSSSAKKSKSKKLDSPRETKPDETILEAHPLFEVQYPKELTPEELALSKIKSQNLLDFMLGQYKEPVIKPVVEEPKKDAKEVKKGGKKEAPKVVEEEKATEPEEPEIPKIPIPNKTLVVKDNRSVIDLPIIFSYQSLNHAVLAHVPEPQFPDPNLEPVPEPVTAQILKKPVLRQRLEAPKSFVILTPKDSYVNETDTDIIALEKPLEETTSTQPSRWVIPAKKKISLYVKFFNETPGQYESQLDFECFFATKGFKVSCSAACDFPSINSKAINVFMQRKKFRPPTPPDCYISKHYIMTEKVFDFGPLLIGKNPAKKSEPAYIHVNSSVFRISNNGRFTAEIDFTLASSVFEGPEYKKGTFIFEPEKMTLATDQTEDLRVWAFPDGPQLYKDQIICMIKNNPVPVLFDIQCTGVKPAVEVDTNIVKFERLLLNQSATEKLKIKNVCAVPVKWNLKGVEKLPQEFVVSQTSGLLRPTEEKVVDITFQALKQEKFEHLLELEIEDNEKLGMKQPSIEVKLQAEAFDINVNLDPNNPENMLNFGDVRVGDVKEQKFPIKNTGLYDIKYRFVMRKKLFRDNFTIEPAEAVIPPGQEKVITFKFCSKEEVKLKTSASTTDIVLEILEGKSLEIFNKLMINVSVNAVFSKYSIVPIKTINFGPIQFDEVRARQFEIKNEGIFEFNYTIFDYNDDARRNEILKLDQPDKPEETSKDAKKKPESKAAPKKDGKKGDSGNELKIGPWTIDAATGSIPPESSQTIKVSFKGVGQKLCEQKLGIHITRRDPNDQPMGVVYEVVAESCIPGINTESFASIFEEQIVIPSLAGSQNVQEQVNSNVFAIEEKTFYFGTVVPSKNPQGIEEQFKITNPGKIPCNVKFDVKKRSSSANELFAFKVKPSTVSIMPHHYKYITVSFEPETIASYGGLFEAIVEHGEQNPKTGKLVFDLRGDCALPSLKVEKPKEWLDDRTPILKFPKTRVDKAVTLPIILKNDGLIPATVEFDLKANESFKFLDQSTYTISAKTSATFNIEFKPRDAGQKKWEIVAKTHDNPYENPKIVVTGEGYQEQIIFDGLPNDSTEEINFGDCIINTEKKIPFKIKNNSNTAVRFNWEIGNSNFIMVPRTGHIAANATKHVTCVFKASATATFKDFPLVCQVQGITREKFADWDSSMTTSRFVTKTEYDWQMKKQEEAERRRREEEEEIAKNKKGGKKDAKKPVVSKGALGEDTDTMPPIPAHEEATHRLEIPIPEPAFQPIEKTEKSVSLKGYAVSDYVKYECATKEILFAPTLMFTSRTYTFNLKNTSLVQMKYTCKLVSAETGAYDTGYYHIAPKSGVVNPNCDEPITVKFSPKEVESTNARLLVISIDNLDPEQQKLIIELDGDTERPICHFELPPPLLKDKKAQDLAQEAKYNIIELESLGTKVKNVKKFYVVNPTNQGYEFEWTKEVEEAGKNTYSSFFRCLTPRGTILSGKKYEMIFEYLPDIDGNHESYWTFSIPSEKIKHHFAMIGRVTEPNVLLDVGSINFGPLLLGGKNKEVIKLKNLEHIPFTFNFDRESVKGDPEYGDSLMVTPMSGVISPDSEIPIEVTFQPKFERFYNYNLMLNIKQKTRYVNLNVKGHGYNLHHSVALSSSPEPLNHHVDHYLDFGNIFINEKKTKTITVYNSGDFNFDLVVKKSQFSFVTISPENATVLKNEKVNIEVTFAPINEHKLNPKSHHFNLQIVSGPTYHFRLAGSARKPNVEFSFVEYDFGYCYVLKQPLAKTAILEIRNVDTSAMSIETLFERTSYLDVQLAPGQVILPSTKPNENVLKVPIVFTPRELTKYHETVEFDINGLHKIGVQIRGEGVPLKLELEKAEDTSVDFGILRIGGDVTKSVRLMNYGKRALALNFDFNNQLQNLLDKYAISVYPSKEFIVNPRDGVDVEIRFNPKARLHQFKYELNYQIVENKESHKLTNIIGSCHGIELKLLQDTIGFGSVVVNSKLTREVQLVNLGDVKAKFNWDTTFCGRYYTITPSSGVVPAHEDLKFQVTFHPDVIDNDISFANVKCNIEGSLPLYINLFGKCIPQIKESIQEVKFQSKVRTVDKKKIVVKNPTDTPWKIKAIISANLESAKGYFYGNETLEVPKNGQAEYEISYLPLSMTKNDKAPQIKEEKHEGSLFFPTPDGSALLFNLVGEALPPSEAGSFNVNVKTKRSETQTIPVKNWLKTTQRFAVAWEVAGSDPTILIKGANTIDIAGDSVKEYKLNITVLKPGNSKTTITFKNEQTGEYIYYLLVIGSLKLIINHF